MARGTVFWTPERLDKIREMLNAGKTYEEIGKYFGKSALAIRIVVHRYKLKEHKHNFSTNSHISMDREKALDSSDLALKIAEIVGENHNNTKEHHQFSVDEGKIMRWVQNPVLFAEEVCRVKLQEYQKAIIRTLENERKVALIMGRGSGKTFTVALYALIKAILRPGIKIVIVGPSLRQSKILFDMITRFIINSGVLGNSVKKLTRKNEYKLVFTNDSEIIAFPCTERGQLLRGIRADIVILEEAAYIPDDVWGVVLPFVATSKEGKIIAISTPKSTRDRFYQIVRSGEYTVLRYPTMVNKFVSDEMISEFRKQMTPTEFRREILAEFTDDSSYFLCEEEIRNATESYTLETYAKEGAKYYLGIDWGRTGHTTALVVVRKDPDGKVRVAYVEELSDTDFSKQIARIMELDKLFHFRKIASEYAGLGMAPTEGLEELGFRIERIVPSLDRKTQIFKEFKRALNDRKVLLPPYKEASRLIYQLLNLGVKVTPTGKMLIHGTSEEIGDDLAHALVYAWYVADRGEQRFYVPEEGLGIEEQHVPMHIPYPTFSPF